MKNQEKKSSNETPSEGIQKTDLFEDFRDFMDMMFPDQDLYCYDSPFLPRLNMAFGFLKSVYPNMDEMDLTKFCLDFSTTHKRDDWTIAEVRDCFIKSVFGD